MAGLGGPTTDGAAGLATGQEQSSALRPAGSLLECRRDAPGSAPARPALVEGRWPATIRWGRLAPIASMIWHRGIENSVPDWELPPVAEGCGDRAVQGAMLLRREVGIACVRDGSQIDRREAGGVAVRGYFLWSAQNSLEWIWGTATDLESSTSTSTLGGLPK